MLRGRPPADGAVGMPGYGLPDNVSGHSTTQHQAAAAYQPHSMSNALAAARTSGSGGGLMYSPQMLMQSALGAAVRPHPAAGFSQQQQSIPEQQRRLSVVTSGYNSFQSHGALATTAAAAVERQRGAAARRDLDDSVDALDPVKREALRPTPPQELQIRRLELLNRTDVSCGSDTLGSMGSSGPHGNSADTAAGGSYLHESVVKSQAAGGNEDSRPTSGDASHSGLQLHAAAPEPYSRTPRKRKLAAGALNGAGGRMADDMHCRFCPKRCRSYEDLNQHEAACIDSRPFECAECFKRFKTKSGLLQHQRIHTQERPYQCSFCDKRFNQKCHVDQHERIHTGEKPFMCSFCGRCFRQRSQQRGHELHCPNGPASSMPAMGKRYEPPGVAAAAAVASMAASSSAAGLLRPTQLPFPHGAAAMPPLNEHMQHTATVDTEDGAGAAVPNPAAVLAAAAAAAAAANAVAAAAAAAHAGEETTSSGDASTSSRAV